MADQKAKMDISKLGLTGNLMAFRPCWCFSPTSPECPASARNPQDKLSPRSTLACRAFTMDYFTPFAKFGPIPYIDRMAVRHFGLLVKNANKGGKTKCAICGANAKKINTKECINGHRFTE